MKAQGKVEVQQSHHRPGQSLRDSGGWGYQILDKSAHEGGKVVRPYAPPTFTTRKYEGWNFNSGNYLFTTDTK